MILLRAQAKEFFFFRFVDFGEVVTLTHQPHVIPQEDSWYFFLLQAE
jgi:hypothetical protein